MRDFVREVLGLELSREERDLAVFDCANGDQLEIFGPDGPQPAEQFARNDIVAGFRVADIDEARRELLAAGVELVGPLQRLEDGYAWQHFRAPDGLVYELTAVPKARSTGL